MTGQTIAERFCQTTNSTARHMLQDAAAMFGAQYVVSAQLEEALTSAEGEAYHAKQGADRVSEI